MVINMFSECIKEIRKKQNLTQLEFSTHLNLIDAEFHALDAVTVSRWERGITKPSLKKCIRILRLFDYDLKYFLLNNDYASDMSALDTIMDKRFNDRLLKLHNIQQYYYNNINHVEFKIKTIPKDQRMIINLLSSLYNNLDIEKDSLFNIDLYLYQTRNKLIGLTFHNNDDDHILGHSISFYFNTDEFSSQIKNNKCKIDYTKSIAYKEGKDITLYNCSRYSSSEELFKFQIINDVSLLCKNSSIQYYSIRLGLKIMYDFLISLGFELSSYQNEHPKGEISVGRKKYRDVILSVKVEKLLSNVELITILKEEKVQGISG
ncbi:transcriptional regulator [Aliivibrio logei]|uniref:Transcriptional regulator n=2 Tax=Aliivibrio logei TaxID=688 RepID=A0A1B9NWS9_ALILO|nr:transcriptional regulator [Aliivibrio logei]